MGHTDQDSWDFTAGAASGYLRQMTNDETSTIAAMA
jgi:hypothetical protein